MSSIKRVGNPGEKIRAPHRIENMIKFWSLLLVAFFYSLTSSDLSIQTLLETHAQITEQCREWQKEKVIFPKGQIIYSKYFRSRKTSLVMKYAEEN